MKTEVSPFLRDEDPLHIIVELTNICNLHCSYCGRDDDALHHSPAQYFPVELLRRIIVDARDAAGINYVTFTGGEVTLHPGFREILEMVRDEGMQVGFVTNGWHFDRVYPVILDNREAVRVIAFSLDGATRETHDRWRGEGSFVRVIRAITRCYQEGIPFTVKVVIRRDTVDQVEQLALLSARLGASALHFSHLLPVSRAVEDDSALSLEERRHVEEEIAALAGVFRMNIGIAVGYYNLELEAPCSALRGTSCNVDYRGRLTLCCNLSGYAGASGEPDVVGDLTCEDFGSAYARLRSLRDRQNERRRAALAASAQKGEEPDLYTGSPCLFCLQSFEKIPWRSGSGGNGRGRSLPVLADRGEGLVQGVNN